MRSTIVILVVVFAILGMLLGFSESFNIQMENPASVAVATVENRINQAIIAMEKTSELDEVKRTDYVDSIDVMQMGIPEDADVDKREVARQLLAGHTEFASIFFLTPSGDLYLGEPYEQQEQLPRLNYADRDWYKGVSATGEPYVSSVFMSAAVHVPAVAVAVPVFENEQTVGYWVAIVNLGDIESDLEEIAGESRILLVDHNATEIVDTGRTGQLTELQSFAQLKSVQRALSGESGTMVESVDGVEMNARFAPARAHPNTWAIVILDEISS
ncbi:MAG: cache domain-containing protein [Thermoproteota archaeon]